MNEWLLFITKMSNISAIAWTEHIIFWRDDEDVRFVLDQHIKLDFYSDSWQQWAGRCVAPLGHIIPIPSHPVFDLTPYAS